MDLNFGATSSVWYVPDFGDNRTLPAEEQGKVKITPLTAVEYQAAQRNQLSGLKGKSIAGIADDFASRQAELRKQLLVKHVVEIVNWRKGEEPIKSFAELYDLIMSAGNTNPANLLLIDNIFDALVDASTLDAGLVNL